MNFKKTSVKTRNPCIACQGSGMLKSLICPRCFGKRSDPWKPGEIEKKMHSPSYLPDFQRSLPLEKPEKPEKKIIFNFCSKCGGCGGPKGNCSLCGGSGWN